MAMNAQGQITFEKRIAESFSCFHKIEMIVLELNCILSQFYFSNHSNELIYAQLFVILASLISNWNVRSQCLTKMKQLKLINDIKE